MLSWHPLFPHPLGWAVPFAGGVLVGGGLRWRPPTLAHLLWRRLAFFYPFLEPAPLCCVHRCGCLAAPSSAPPSTPWLGGWLGSGSPPFRLWEGSFRALFAGVPVRVAYWPRLFPAVVHCARDPGFFQRPLFLAVSPGIRFRVLRALATVLLRTALLASCVLAGAAPLASFPRRPLFAVVD